MFIYLSEWESAINEKHIFIKLTLLPFSLCREGNTEEYTVCMIMKKLIPMFVFRFLCHFNPLWSCATFFFSPNPALPVSPGMPPSRSGRPYTTFELDQIRQMNRG